MSCTSLPRPPCTTQHDVILRVTSTAICGSDLHIYQGTMPRMAMQKGAYSTFEHRRGQPVCVRVTPQGVYAAE
eukprot:44242-Eustigmatos_ZCMA.PRE.1